MGRLPQSQHLLLKFLAVQAILMSLFCILNQAIKSLVEPTDSFPPFLQEIMKRILRVLQDKLLLTLYTVPVALHLNVFPD